MDYEKIMCKFCKECTKMEIRSKIIKSTYKTCSDVIVIRCENFCPKYDFEEKEQYKQQYCSFFDITGGEDEQAEDRIYRLGFD